MQHRMAAGGARALVGTVAALALAAGVLAAAPAQAADKTAPKLSSSQGPVKTTITITGTCGPAGTGNRWFAPRFRLFFPDAFIMGPSGPSYFAESTGTTKANGSYSGSITVPATGTYTTKGPGPAQPGKELTKAVSGEIRVLTVCQNSLTRYPWNDFSTAWTKFTVTGKTMAMTAKAKPTIKGTAAVGKRLKASTGVWSPKPTKYAYQWLRGKAPIAGKKAKKAKYKVTKADKGKKLRVRVTASRPGYSSATALSAKIKIKR